MLTDVSEERLRERFEQICLECNVTLSTAVQVKKEKIDISVINYYIGILPFLRLNGYQNLRLLEDTIIGTNDYFTTRALIVGFDYDGFDVRYCYQDRGKAIEACNSLQSAGARPLDGYSAIKGRGIDLNGERMQEYIKSTWPEKIST